MIHIAEAGEAKGRVVVQACTGLANPVALEAAVWLARAFQSEIESLFVEDQQLIELASYPFAREISLTGRVNRAICCEDIEREFRHASAAFHSDLAAFAHAAEVKVTPRVIRDEPVNALMAACAAFGPWNAIALAEPFTSPACPSLKALFATVDGATGLLVVGPNAVRTAGPIVIALEQSELLSAMLSAADRLAAIREVEILVCPIAALEPELAEIEGAARLVLAEREGARLTVSALVRGAEAAVAEALRRQRPGLVIGQFGGLLVPEEGDLRPLAAALECPMLLMR